MNKNPIVRLVFLLFSFIIYSCEPENPTPTPISPQNNENSITSNQLKGEWIVDEWVGEQDEDVSYGDNSQGMYFLSFYPTSNTTGKYSFCITKKGMSSGNYTIEGNIVKLTNFMDNPAWKIYIYPQTSSTELVMEVYCKAYDGTHSINRYCTAAKGSGSYSSPIVGQTYSYAGLSATYGSFNQYAILLSNYLIRVYCQQVNGTHQIYNDYNYYYVYRYYQNKKIVYTQKCNGEGEVRAYELTNTLDNFAGTEIYF